MKVWSFVQVMVDNSMGRAHNKEYVCIQAEQTTKGICTRSILNNQIAVGAWRPPKDDR